MKTTESAGSAADSSGKEQLIINKNNIDNIDVVDTLVELDKFAAKYSCYPATIFYIYRVSKQSKYMLYCSHSTYAWVCIIALCCDVLLCSVIFLIIYPVRMTISILIRYSYLRCIMTCGAESNTVMWISSMERKSGHMLNIYWKEKCWNLRKLDTYCPLAWMLILI